MIVSMRLGKALSQLTGLLKLQQYWLNLCQKNALLQLRSLGGDSDPAARHPARFQVAGHGGLTMAAI